MSADARSTSRFDSNVIHVLQVKTMHRSRLRTHNHPYSPPRRFMCPAHHEILRGRLQFLANVGGVPWLPTTYVVMRDASGRVTVTPSGVESGVRTHRDSN